MDIAKLRAETVGCAEVLHFNNAGSALMPDSVFAAMHDHLTLERRIGGYEALAAAQDLEQGFYDTFAKLLSAQPSEIAFMESATRAWTTAFYGLGLREGDRVLTHESEYASNYLAFLQLKKRLGIEIDVAASDADGAVDPVALEAAITSRTRVISLGHVPTQGGLVNPAAEVGRIAKAHGVAYLLDACQSAGQMPLDVEALGCDMLTGTGRKWLRGPRGTGFLYVRQGFMDQIDPPVIDLYSAKWTAPDTFEFAESARRFETFEYHVAGKIGLAEAARLAMELGLEAIEARVKALAESLREGLMEAGCMVTDQGAERCGIVTFLHPRMDPASLTAQLREKNINVSVSTATAAQLDFIARGLDAITRASPHYYNSEDEVAQFLEAITNAS